jgi:hypothetical protein
MNSEQLTMNNCVDYGLCRSIAGRDCGKLYLIFGTAPGRTLVVDGKLHKRAKPKAKNPRHLQLLNERVELLNHTDKEIRRRLYNFSSLQRGN